MEQSIAGSFDCRVALVGGDPVAVFGCAKHDELSAIPWLLGTPRVDRQRRFLTQYIPALVGEWREQFPLLFNFVHTNNKTSIRWLQWLGFTIADPIPFGVGQQLFHPFYSNRPCVPSLQ